jgi:hypothetical protein
MEQTSTGNTCPHGPTFLRNENLLVVSSVEKIK